MAGSSPPSARMPAPAGGPARRRGRSKAVNMAPPDDCCSNVETAMGAQGLGQTEAVLLVTAKPVPPGTHISCQHLGPRIGSGCPLGSTDGQRNCHLDCPATMAK